MRAKKYAYFFENIDKNTPMDEYKKVFDINVKFKDPFHEVVGIDKVYDIFKKMYVKLDKPKFKITEIIEQNNIAYIKWNFIFYFKNHSKKESFEGLSRIEFNEMHKVTSHTDYWDAASNIYENIPIISFMIKFIKRKIKT